MRNILYIYPVNGYSYLLIFFIVNLSFYECLK